MQIKRVLFACALLFPFVIPSAYAKTDYFKYPEVHNDFCGAKIDYRICKCARHNQMCKDIGMERNAASDKLYAAFDEYVKGQKEMFGRSCMASGGIYSVLNAECGYCEANEVRSEGVCKNPKDVRSIEEIYNLPKVETVGGTQIVGYVVLGEGEFFLYSPGRGKWTGPISGGGLQIFEGDVLYTTIKGRAQLRFGSSNFYLLERSTLRMPSPQQERTLLERGTLFIWSALKRLVTNDMLEIEEGGAHSITGRKGTTFMITSEDGKAQYAVQEGAIDVWLKDSPQKKKVITTGTAAVASASGIAEAPYEWDALLQKHGLEAGDFSEPPKITPFAFIDPDAVNPTEVAYTGDLVGDYKSSRGGSWGAVMTYGGIAVVLVVGFFFVRRLMRKRVSEV
ncbi:MAG: hypothetical protein AAB417_03630 [Patescibacteria group bacterium]